MNAEILTVGTELLLGDILNSNSQFLSRELAAYGIQLLYQSTVGDNDARLRQVLSLALERSDLVLLTGGLGPTPDDLTRETVCEVLDIPLVLHEESWLRIQEYFSNTGRELTANNKKQAMLPADCIVFPNDHGTAPGCAIEKDGRVIILLPGPPKELIPMFNTYVAPYLSKFSGGTIFSQTVGVFGIPESTVAERLADLLSEANPTVAPYAKDGEVTLRVTARAADTDAARALCAPMVEEIRQRLGANIYGVDSGSLQKAVVDLLGEKGKKIATAESCTAGMLSGRLTEVAGVSSVFECGIAAYSKEIKHQILGVSEDLLEKYGAVSPEVASAMAVGARRVGQADLGVGITGVAGPDSSEGKPVGTVYIALADEKRTWVKKIVAGHAADDREYVRFVATSHALDLTRRYLEALPAVMAGGEALADTEPPAPVIPVAPKTGSQRRFLSYLLPWKGDSKWERLGKIAAWVAAVALLVAGILLINHYVVIPDSNRRLMDKLAAIYGGDTSGGPPSNARPENYPEGMDARFYGLYDMNEDVAGWIKIDDTNINFPVMKDPGNGYYGSHNFEKHPSRYGVPYFDSAAALVSPLSVNRTLTIYGNNSQDDQIFSELMKYYSSIDFLRTHSLVEMNTLYQNRQWKIFAVMIVDENDSSFSYTRTKFDNNAAFMQFVGEVRERSLYDVPVDVSADDPLLFLSTQAHVELQFTGARLVVAARAVRADEAASPELTGVTKNADVLLPKAWLDKHQITKATPKRTTSSTAVSTQPSDPLSTGEDGTGTGDMLESETSGVTTKKTTAGTGDTAPSGSTSATSSATTSSTSVTTATTTTTSSSGDGDAPPVSSVKQAVRAESEYLQNFKLYDTVSETLFPVSGKEDLQKALTYIVKGELGNKRSATNTTAAWEAQAVASYTYILNYCAMNNEPYPYAFKTLDLNDSNDKKIYDAVGKVAGTKIIDVNQSIKKAPIQAMYFASSPGVTASSQYVFTSTLPYLQSVRSTYDTLSYIERYTNNREIATSTYSITLTEFTSLVKNWAQSLKGNQGKTIAVGFDSKAGEKPVYATSWDGGAGKYVVNTNVYYTADGGGKTYVTGKNIRVAVDGKDENSTKLRSHCFRVTDYNKDTDIMTFQVWGYGHGVGMSQCGAIGYANEPYGKDKNGKPLYWTYDQILTHYYSITPSSSYQIVAPNWGTETGKADEVE